MDIQSEVERALEGMEWAEVASTLQAAIYSLLTDTFNPLPPASVGLEFNTRSQPATSQSVGYAADMSSLHQGDFLHSCNLHSNSAYSRGQYNNAPAVRLPDATNYNLHPITEIRRKHESQQTGYFPYVKKPLNAFMLYIKEQRPNVAPEIRIRGSPAVNKYLGEKWRSLTEEKRATYVYQARQERRLHEQLHPGWSNAVNYGKKRKRDRRKPAKKAAAFEPEDNTQQANWLCSMPLQSVTEPFTSQPIKMEASCSPTWWGLHFDTQTTSTVPEPGPTPPVIEHFELLHCTARAALLSKCFNLKCEYKANKQK